MSGGIACSDDSASDDAPSARIERLAGIADTYALNILTVAPGSFIGNRQVDLGTQGCVPSSLAQAQACRARIVGSALWSDSGCPK